MDYSSKFPIYSSHFIHRIITDYVIDDFKNQKIKFLVELKQKTELINYALDEGKIYVEYRNKRHHYTSDLGCGEYSYQRFKGIGYGYFWGFMYFYLPDDLIKLNDKMKKVDTKNNLATNRCYRYI